MNIAEQHKVKKLLVQTDYSPENSAALALLSRRIKEGYTIRIDDLEISDDELGRVITLRPNRDVIEHAKLEGERYGRLNEHHIISSKLSRKDLMVLEQSTLRALSARFEALKEAAL